MTTKQIYIVIAASCLALLGLIAIQVRWMTYSQELLEEQFEHRVDMALCQAVETTTNEPCCGPTGTGSATPIKGCRAEDVTESMILSDSQLRRNLNSSLAFYDIQLPYTVQVANPTDSSADNIPAYSCQLDPLVAGDTRRLELVFPTKESYILRRMNVMIGSSILILSVILLVFFVAGYFLIKQKRLADQNIVFFNHMAHEFKTPLTNIKLAAGLLGRKKPDLKDDQVLQIISKESGQLIYQVERFLQMAGLEFNKNPLRLQPLNLEALLRETIAGLSPLIQEKGASLTLEVKGPLPLMEGDELHLRNAFRNLIDNALKYCESAPEIHIALEAPTPQQIQLTIRDNGLGIDQQELPGIFQEFKRGRQASSMPFSGFGLGLAYVKKIVDLHRGAISVIAERRKGSSFSLSFPVK
ncbi:MAG: HAMP domain-containing histidine kinase [Haliscomenobacter sp.]|nr:HAMP domain-containing histidine kinase [Haliscomenobacter sp.]